MRESYSPVVLTVCCAVLIGCGDPDESARFEADDTAGLSECMADEFPFEPGFLAARTRNNRTGIFLQTSPDVNSRSDVVYFELHDSDDIPVDEPIELSETSETTTGARGKAAFFSSCPYQHDTLKIRGSIQFDSFGTEAYDVISGHLVDAYAVDARDQQVAIGELTGSWQFVVRKSRPHEDFYAIPERP